MKHISTIQHCILFIKDIYTRYLKTNYRTALSDPDHLYFEFGLMLKSNYFQCKHLKFQWTIDLKILHHELITHRIFLMFKRMIVLGFFVRFDVDRGLPECCLNEYFEQFHLPQMYS